ncbi:MAG: uncharacterized protein H6Q05_1605 [Acidobacteria bacterium]|nr:uncharacterized protein [Acidobacteriota bacterium]
MTRDREDILIEQAASAFRERNASGRIQPSPAWWDLAPADRDALFKVQLESRIIESALHPRGFSATIQAVLARIM